MLRYEKFDYSTIDTDFLQSLPTLDYVSDRQKHMGSGCAGDAPGYPSYFIQYSYRQTSDGVPFMHYRGKNYELFDEGWTRTRVKGTKREDVLRRLWKPLPLEHERVQLWIIATFKHCHHCYRDPLKPHETIIFPVPNYKLTHVHIDERWRQEFIDEANAKKTEADAKIIAETTAIATPDNHLGTIIVRKFYPQFVPTQELIDNPPEERSGLWWERLATCPTPEECASTQSWKFQHPMNGTWCQHCGWKKDGE